MRKIVVTQFVSLDGVIEDPGGSEDFRHSAWSFKFDRGDDGDQFKLDEVMAADALLLGKKTYLGFAEAWPSREGDFADKFNEMEKYVVSSTLTDPEWNNTTVISENVPEEIAKLRERPGDGDVLVNGSAQLIRTMVEHDLVDEYRLMLFPVILGSGLRLFPDDLAEKTTLKHVSTQPVGPDGVQVLTYVPARD
jgi:dihydrofolate reductase